MTAVCLKPAVAHEGPDGCYTALSTVDRRSSIHSMSSSFALNIEAAAQFLISTSQGVQRMLLRIFRHESMAGGGCVMQRDLSCVVSIGLHENV